MWPFFSNLNFLILKEILFLVTQRLQISVPALPHPTSTTPTSTQGCKLLYFWEPGSQLEFNLAADIQAWNFLGTRFAKQTYLIQ